MKRRNLLKLLGTTAVASTAGCTSVMGGSSGSQTYLDKRESQRAKSEALSYPAYGEKLPKATLTDPITGDEYTTTKVNNNILMTFFYSHCNTICPRLISTLSNVQADSIKNDYTDEVVFLPITFDPKRDTADRLIEYADQMNINLDVGNWHFLRPKSVKRAKEVVAEKYGVGFQKESDVGTQYMFTHLGLIILANPKGYVERAWTMTTTSGPSWQEVRDALKKIRKAESQG
ncbi:MAG: SCO family protein [Halobacteria archaeon]|nr:SCO family protein [Halobacteria archaeon]